MADNSLQPPSNEHVERAFLDLLAGRRSRDEIDRWAAQWVCADDPPDMDEAVWDALGKLHGCAKPDLNGRYVHSDAHIEAWYQELRRATAR